MNEFEKKLYRLGEYLRDNGLNVRLEHCAYGSGRLVIENAENAEENADFGSDIVNSLLEYRPFAE